MENIFPTGDHRNVQPECGISQRAYLATHTQITIDLQDGKWLENILGRKIDFKDPIIHLDAQIEAMAMIKVKSADALIKELNK